MFTPMLLAGVPKKAKAGSTNFQGQLDEMRPHAWSKTCAPVQLSACFELATWYHA